MKATLHAFAVMREYHHWANAVFLYEKAATEFAQRLNAQQKPGEDPYIVTPWDVSPSLLHAGGDNWEAKPFPPPKVSLTWEDEEWDIS